MSKFGLMDEEEADGPAETLSDRLAMFQPVRPKAIGDVAAMDAAAAEHGFVSREAAPAVLPARPLGRRRRAVPAEPTRHLAIRLTASAYDRFVAYADRHQLTYHDALSQLLDDCGER